MSTPGKTVPERRPTLQSIAAMAGVSHQTVSNVLNAPDRVAEHTRARVLDVIEQLNYRPNETARSLARRSTRLISFHIGAGHHNEASMLDPFMRELAKVGAEHAYRVVLDIAGDEDEDQIASYEELHARRSVDGVVIPETHVGDTRPAWLVEHGMPTVAFGRPWADPDPRHSWVDVDGGHGMRLVAEHLLQTGHERIAYVGPPRNRGMEDDRLDGLLAGLVDSGVEPDPALHLVVESPSGLRQALPALLADHRPTALACRDDAFAFEAIQVLDELGLRPGEDVAVTGFDDSDLARICRPQITSVAQPIREVAELIWESLLAQLAGTAEAPLRRLTLPRLVTRDSTTTWSPA
ncbi:LacI family DNA-binding transcriptional regulator [Actinotalea subterranea]|uniref:LacI family DNA-binding transcriptional regulator n=1 Tax=Actinotalea subterranea TaxID=2607497 RepID=UPI0011EBC610|nr:LacI family DNA-binding transcriptional regulator [Actinotalea subterranea]